MSAYELDCRGLACPEPVVRCRTLCTMHHPEMLTVLVDNAAANENITRLLGRNGYKVHSIKEGGVWQVTGERDSLARDDSKESSDVVCRVTEPVDAGQNSKILVFITTDTLGRGDETLGGKLMENFLSTLPELGDSLWRVILLNGAVKLAATQGKALESLQNLERSGVNVLVCGACLTFYDLLEAKAVGETTNMLDVVTSLALADKVIRP